ncbi:MAG: TIGR02206 family membrane protein [Candidatus Dormibacteraeota bacterium]|nr:TIGR02206 family membrane protein [Candidatus Dormibacteraeota bacterium]
MRILSTEYLLSLAAVAVVIAGVTAAARVWPGRWTTVFARALAVFLVANQLSWYVVERNSLSLQWSLPLGLCEIGTFVAGAALWWRTPLLVEITYFWGLGGTVQALLTPELDRFSLFPTYFYFQYYINHGGLVLAAVFLVVGLNLVPRPGAVLRVAVITAAYLVVVAGIDRLTGGDYLYLRQPPPTASVLNLLGPWPWYIGGMIGLGIAFLIVLNSPFWAMRRLARRTAQPEHQLAGGG